MRIAKAIWLVLILLLLTVVSGFVYLFITSHEQIIELAIEQLHRPDLKNILRDKYFTESDFVRLRRMGYSFIPIILGVVGYFIILRKKIFAFINDVLRTVNNLLVGIKRSIQTSTKPTKIILATTLLLMLVRSVYYALHYYPQYDECWNYNYFLSNSIFSSFFAYNNYPLHNILTYLLQSVLPDNTFTLRLTNIILGLVNMLLIFSLTKKIFKKEAIALAAVAIFSVLPTVVFYMLFARGVMLALLFGIGLLYFLFIKKTANWSLADCAIIVLLACLGTFSMISFPVFLIIFFVISAVTSVANKNSQELLTIIYTGLAALLITLVLYLPILLGTGLNFDTSSSYLTNSINWDAFIQKANFISRNQIGFYTGAYIFLAINFLLIFISKHRLIIAFNIALLLIPFVIPLIFKTYLPARAIGFQVFGYLFTLLILLELVLNHTSLPVFAMASFVTIVAFNYTAVTHTFFTWSARQDQGAFEIAKVLQQNKVQSYYDQSSAFQYFVPSILYHHKIENKQIRFFTKNKNSSRYIEVENFTGNTFVIKSGDYTPSSNNKILFNYKDEYRDFIVYKIIKTP